MASYSLGILAFFAAAFSPAYASSPETCERQLGAYANFLEEADPVLYEALVADAPRLSRSLQDEGLSIPSPAPLPSVRPQLELDPVTDNLALSQDQSQIVDAQEVLNEIYENKETLSFRSTILISLVRTNELTPDERTFPKIRALAFALENPRLFLGHPMISVDQDGDPFLDIDINAILERKNGDRGTALFYALQRGHIALAEFLLDMGADAGSFYDGREYLRFILSDFWPVEVVPQSRVLRKLIAQGAEVNSKSGNALFYITRSTPLEVIKILLDAGADPNALNEKGETVLTSLACKDLTKEQFEVLIANGAQLEKPNHAGQNALGRLLTDLPTAEHLRQRLHIAESLLELGADATAKDHGGFSALHFLEAYEQIYAPEFKHEAYRAHMKRVLELARSQAHAKHYKVRLIKHLATILRVLRSQWRYFSPRQVD